MLRGLHIRDLAVIEEVSVDMGPGFTVLTGETGAGKSILIDALALALGERSDALAIRAGASRLEVTARFDATGNAPVLHWLRDHELGDEGEECLLRRVVGTDGRSRAWINGRPVAATQLRELGGLLADICGQQDYQSLRHRNTQRDLLDGSEQARALRHALREAHGAWQAAWQEHRSLLERARDRDARRELLAFQVAELAALAPVEAEFPELEREHRTLAHRVRIAEALTRALAHAEDDDQASAQAAVAAARQALLEVASVDGTLEEPLRLLAEAEIQVREAAAAVRQRLAGLEGDPGQETALADRLAAYKELARKHRVAPPELPPLLLRLQGELDQLTHVDESLDRLAALAETRRQALRDVASRLTAQRQTAAASLGQAVTANLASLGMAGGRFQVQLHPLADREPGPDGAEDVEFLVTTNAGQPPAPLSRVASGGELSRISLAIQVVATADRSAPTLVFDEVDAGVGGAVAEIVGRKLRELSQGRQVLCITHLPQVATLAHHHLSVAKASTRGTTRTTVRRLTPDERLEETARMLGGLTITEQTRAHAREMLAAGEAPAKPARRKRAGP